MKTTLQKVRDGIAAALQGKTPEELADEQHRDAVKAAVGRFLDSNPDWKPSQQSSQQPAPTVAPVTNTKQKAKRIMKTLGDGGFSPHVIDPEMLARARAKCREIVAADPAAYSYIIESAPLRDHEVV